MLGNYFVNWWERKSNPLQGVTPVTRSIKLVYYFSWDVAIFQVRNSIQHWFFTTLILVWLDVFRSTTSHPSPSSTLRKNNNAILQRMQLCIGSGTGQMFVEVCAGVLTDHTRGRAEAAVQPPRSNDAASRHRELEWMQLVWFPLCSPAYITQPWCNTTN